MTSGGDMSGGGGKQASDIGMDGRLFPDLGWAGMLGSKGGTYLLTQYARKDSVSVNIGAFC